MISYFNYVKFREDKKLNEQEISWEDNSVNELGNVMEDEEYNPEYIKSKTEFLEKANSQNQKNWKQLQCDCSSEECDVEVESDDNDLFWGHNDRSNNSNKSHSTEESVVELDPEDQVGLDILLKKS